MQLSHSDADTLLVGIPMVAILLMACFRLDGLISRPRGEVKQGRRLNGWDERGVPVCTDPEPVDFRISRRRY